MPISDIFTTPFLICLGICLLLLGLLGMYFTQKIMEQNHKITSMFELVSTMAEEMNAIRANIMIPHQFQPQFNMVPTPIGGQSAPNESLIHVSDDEDEDDDDDDEDEDDEDDDDEDEDEDEDEEDEDVLKIKSINFNNLESSTFNINNEIESEVIFNLGDLRNLDYPEKSFDIIYCISVLEHTENYKEIVDHFYRLLVPGGHLILTFDVSLDGDRTISVSDGQKLLDYLGSRFTPVYEATDIKSVINRRGEVLTTTYVATIDKNLLPWRSPWKNVLKNVLSLKKPKFIFELACYCQVFEKN